MYASIVKTDEIVIAGTLIFVMLLFLSSDLNQKEKLNNKISFIVNNRGLYAYIKRADLVPKALTRVGSGEGINRAKSFPANAERLL
jgi:hypothetical protein